MTTKFKIIEPCNQDWNKMNILDGQKFCDQCKKEVFDFTSYSQKEIVEKLKGSPKVCGRLDKTQLAYTPISKQILNSNFPKIALFIGLGSILGLTEPVVARPFKHKTEIKENTEWSSILPTKILNDSLTIKGKVFDSHNFALPGVNVIFKGTAIGSQTNMEGEFTITFPVNLLSEKNFLMFSFIGYKTGEYQFYEKNKYLKIQLKEDASVLGGIIFYQEQNFFEKTGHFFRHLFSKKKTCR